MGELTFDKEIINQEERLYTEEIENLILEHHENYEIVERKLRYKIDGKVNLETDVVLIVKTTNTGVKRAIGIELKENDILKAISQAMERREYFHYFYVVLNMRVSTIVNWIFLDHNLYSAIKNYSIGLISAYEKTMVLPSKFFNVYKLHGFVW